MSCDGARLQFKHVFGGPGLLSRKAQLPAEVVASWFGSPKKTKNPCQFGGVGRLQGDIGGTRAHPLVLATGCCAPPLPAASPLSPDCSTKGNFPSSACQRTRSPVASCLAPSPLTVDTIPSCSFARRRLPAALSVPSLRLPVCAAR